jgi:hypothetical protein
MSTLTWALTRPGPASGSSSSWMRCTYTASWRRCWSNCFAPIESSLSGSGLDSMRPNWSTTVTRSGGSPGTLEATRCTIASTWPCSSVLPLRSSSTTEALAGSFSRVNALGLGRARCTRASRTGRRLAMVRASSVCSACW